MPNTVYPAHPPQHNSFQPHPTVSSIVPPPRYPIPPLRPSTIPHTRSPILPSRPSIAKALSPPKTHKQAGEVSVVTAILRKADSAHSASGEGLGGGSSDVLALPSLEASTTKDATVTVIDRVESQVTSDDCPSEKEEDETSKLPSRRPPSSPLAPVTPPTSLKSPVHFIFGSVSPPLHTSSQLDSQKRKYFPLSTSNHLDQTTSQIN